MLLRPALRIATALAALLVIGTSALADLRSPDGTAELGATLADDPAVRELVATTVVDALLEDASASAPDVALLLPLVRPIVSSAVEAALDAPAGRAALAETLTDAARQLTFDGPIVLDLRDAVLAAADASPEPLATLARAAAERGAVGVVVIGEQEGTAAPNVPSDTELARIGPLPATTARTLAWVLLGVVAVVGLAVAGGDRSARLRGTGGALLLVGAPAALLLRLAPAEVVDRLTARLTDVGTSVGAGDAVEPLAAVVPVLADGVTDLLAPTGTAALTVAGLGAVLLVVGVALRLLPDRG